MPPRRDRIQVRTSEDLAPHRFRPAASPENAVATPQARPLDTFVRPADPRDFNAGKQTAQLAQALAGLAPSLSRFSSAFVEQRNEKMYNDGKARALELQRLGKSYKQAIDEGLIKRGDSPFFRAGVQEQLGAAAASSLADYIDSKLPTIEHLRDSTNIAEFDQAIMALRGEWEQQNVGTLDRKADQYFNVGFNTLAEQLIARRRSEFAQSIGPKLETQGDNAFYSTTSRGIVEDAGTVPTEIMAAALQRTAQDRIDEGHDPSQVFRTMARAIRTAAIRGEAKSKDIARLLMLVADDKGIPLADRDLTKDIFGETMAQVLAVRSQRVNEEDTTRRLEHQKATDTAYAGAMAAVLANPNADISAFATSVAHIRGAAEVITAVRDTARGITEWDDEHLVDDLWTGVYENKTTVTDIVKQYAKGGLTRKTADDLIQRVRQQESDREQREDRRRRNANIGSDDSLLGEDVYSETYSEISAQFNGAKTGTAVGEDAARQRTARALWRREWLNYRTGAGANATLAEQNEFAEKTSAAIVKLARRGSRNYDEEGGTRQRGEQRGGSTPAGQKPAGAKTQPEISHSDLILLQRSLSGDDTVVLPPELRRRINALGSDDAVQAFLDQQIALYQQLR